MESPVECPPERRVQHALPVGVPPAARLQHDEQIRRRLVAREGLGDRPNFLGNTCWTVSVSTVSLFIVHVISSVRMSDATGDFTDLEFPRVIDTSTTKFIDEFYTPLLSRATDYRRGVGYFTTNWVQSAARGIAQLADNGGIARWLTSPKLTEDDWEAIKQGDEARTNALLYDALEETISDLRYDLEYDTWNAVAWMIADGLLEIKFAIPTHALSGDFHDKFGILQDANANRVAFHGSQNDSDHALRNYEAYTIDCDWLGSRDEEGVDYQERRFDTLWNGDDENVDIYTIPEGVAEEIAELRDPDNRPYTAPDTTPPFVTANGGASIGITLRDYQQEAVDQWFSNDCRGLFQMATGTGKTFTALAALDEYLSQRSEPVLTVIAVPVTHLAAQWADELEKFGFKSPRLLFGTANSDWKRALSRTVSNVNLGIRDQEFVITTHTTLSSPTFREKVQSLDATTVLIGDEVHRQGSESHRKGLLATYDARIGLSATPERHYDEEGSDHLLDYFSGVVFEYTLNDAIPTYLTPYQYEPLIVEMTEEELEEYSEMSRRLGIASARDDVEEEVAERIAMLRADIVKSAENKYRTLRTVLQELESPDHLLVYTNPEQITEVQRILNEYDIRQHKFTYEEDEDQRQDLLDRFEAGVYDALVAMRCLDEGVDIEPTRQAILMSNSGNPMQFIQRRGRVLRRSEGKEKAVIYDMIVVPSMNPTEDVRKSERGVLEKELDRFEEFAANALNEHAARNVIDGLRNAYRI